MRIKAAIEAANTNNKPINFYEADSMEVAVQYCKHAVLEYPKLTPIVLLSTASASYNMFKNFEAKGEEFAQHILARD